MVLIEAREEGRRKDVSLDLPGGHLHELDLFIAPAWYFHADPIAERPISRVGNGDLHYAELALLRLLHGSEIRECGIDVTLQHPRYLVGGLGMKGLMLAGNSNGLSRVRIAF